jgi:hypothetical protein
VGRPEVYRSVPNAPRILYAFRVHRGDNHRMKLRALMSWPRPPTMSAVGGASTVGNAGRATYLISCCRISSAL